MTPVSRHHQLVELLLAAALLLYQPEVTIIYRVFRDIQTLVSKSHGKANRTLSHD